MCGITGFVTNNGPRPDRAVLEVMNGAIFHRGPDEDGFFVDDRAALAMRRLAIIDLASGQQPIWNADRTKCIFFNGEIYNYQELRKGLDERGHKFYTNSDTEAIIHLYDEYGVDCLQHLRGMFAIAIWDTFERTLFLARDRVGKKPLLYSHQTNGDLIFGSEFQALLKHPTVSREVDREAIDAYLSYSCVPAPLTGFKSIRKLEPGHWLKWKDGVIETRRYWLPDFQNKIKISEEEAIEETTRLLREATKLRMISEVPLGAFLSGGVDSSIIVALMAEVSETPVKTFSIGFEEEDFNELRYARMVAEHVGAEYHEFVVKPNALEILPKLVKHYGEPYADSSAIPTYYVSKETRKHVTVALNGDGGDESFGGYERYVAMELSEKVRTIPAWMRRTAIAGIPERIAGISTVRNVKSVLKASSLSPDRRYANWISTFTDSAKSDVGFTSRSDQLGSIDRFLSNGSLQMIDRMLYADLLNYLPNDLLVKVDIASMANSLEARSPFLDHKVIEFAASLPGNLKTRGTTTKFLLKKVASRLVPPEAIYRRKWGFGMPIGRWLRSDLSELVNECLFTNRFYQRGLFEKSAIERLWREHQTATKDHTWKLWNLLMLELWYREFIDR